VNSSGGIISKAHFKIQVSESDHTNIKCKPAMVSDRRPKTEDRVDIANFSYSFF